jgi:predicted nucleic acid-binding protein
MAIVLDASMTLALFLPDESSASGDLIERVLRDGAIAPMHWPFEVANGCVVARRRNRLTEDEAMLILADIAAMNVVLDIPERASLRREVVDLAFSHHLTVYDAAYLELALRRRFVLATLDARLQDASRSSGCALLTE